MPYVAFVTHGGTIACKFTDRVTARPRRQLGSSRPFHSGVQGFLGEPVAMCGGFNRWLL